VLRRSRSGPELLHESSIWNVSFGNDELESFLSLIAQGETTEVRRKDVGQRLLDTTSQIVIKKFFEKLAEAAVE
jgi:hypothetical protein